MPIFYLKNNVNNNKLINTKKLYKDINVNKTQVINKNIIILNKK